MTLQNSFRSFFYREEGLRSGRVFGIIAGSAVLLFAIGGFFWWQNKVCCAPPSVSSHELRTADFDVLRALSETKPELATFVDHIITWEERWAEDTEREETLLTLGLAWKSLADQTRDPAHYRRAFDVYEVGIQKTEKKDTGFLMNAANMLQYLKEYERAEGYYQAALLATPGDQEIYVRLADLYDYHLHKTPEEVVALIDQGLQVAVMQEQLLAYKQGFLKRHGLPSSEPTQ